MALRECRDEDVGCVDDDLPLLLLMLLLFSLVVDEDVDEEEEEEVELDVVRELRAESLPWASMCLLIDLMVMNLRQMLHCVFVLSCKKSGIRILQ